MLGCKRIAGSVRLYEVRQFLKVINKAKEACANSGDAVSDHFAGTGIMVPIGSGSKREIEDLALTCYACYLIAQNGDPFNHQ